MPKGAFPHFPKQGSLPFEKGRYRGIYPGDSTGNFTLQFGKVITLWDKIPNLLWSIKKRRVLPHIQFQELFREFSNIYLFVAKSGLYAHTLSIELIGLFKAAL